MLAKEALVSALLAALMITFLLFFYPATASATTDPADTGTQDERTNIDEPGASDSPEELADLNVQNTFTITYNDGNGTLNGALRIMITLTLIMIAPTLLVMLTSFTRIIIVLHFTRTALNTQTSPPNIVMIGIALFLTFFIMRPTISDIYVNAIQPLDEGRITQEEAFEAAVTPIRAFMYPQTQQSDTVLFMNIGGYTWDGENETIPLEVLVPAFILSELRTAFIIGFVIYIPFIVIDMVVASVLMSMGMMMLPPTTISMPFKILLFVLADGWELVIGNLVRTFY
ncbi:MAG: flagellar type III secretion system pore protein FliP [Lachnospiraceae bacterium]|nr:flagellar type III secretion system pore protein FliP [Lachnospiraceae bacterium]